MYAPSIDDHAPDARGSPATLAVIQCLATGTPPLETAQAEAARAVATLDRFAAKGEKVGRIYAAGCIEARQLALDFTRPETLLELQGEPIQARMRLFEQHALPLAERVARAALEGRGGYSAPEPIRAEEIALLVVVSSTGFVAPGLDVQLIERLGLRPDTARLTVGFMGCAAAFSGLRIACDHVRAHPGHKALLVCVELSSVNANFADTPNDIITHSLFGDGCAAAVVGALSEAQAREQGALVVEGLMSAVAAGTTDGITLGLHEQGITCTLSRQLPAYIEQRVGGLVDDFLRGHGLTRAALDFWAIHPGGRRIIDSVQRALGLDAGQLAVSWEVLRRHGNMLSPAVLFVLERTLARLATEPAPRAEGRLGFALSFSPGVGVEGALLKKYSPSRRRGKAE